MKTDSTIECVRAVRHQISAEYNHNPRQLVAHYREMEKAYKDRMLKGKLAKSATVGTA